jgi:hypothetical protein
MLPYPEPSQVNETNNLFSVHDSEPYTVSTVQRKTSYTFFIRLYAVVVVVAVLLKSFIRIEQIRKQQKNIEYTLIPLQTTTRNVDDCGKNIKYMNKENTSAL